MGVYRVRERKSMSRKKEFYLEKETDKLELYLNDVYKKECVFKIEKKEVEFVQVGIETLVKQITDRILDYFEEHRSMPNLDDGLCEILKNRERKTSPNEIIKVGSFYEGTKNGFPDEFDFIFPLYCSESSFYYSEDDGGVHIPGSMLFQVFMSAYSGLSTVTKKYKDAIQYNSSDEKSKIYFDKYIDAKGPASKLHFVYERGSGEITDIHVDFVPAVKVIGDKLENTTDITCKLKEFRTEILHTGSYFLVGSGGYGITFTDTEVRLMKTVLSENHVKVYRILKQLVNGHEDGEKLADHLRARKSHMKVYSSYMMKTMVVRHHYKCTNTDPNEIGKCMLEVLDEMSIYDDIESFPFLANQLPVIQQKTSFCQSACQVMKTYFFVENMQYPIPLVPYIQSMTVYLRYMQNSDSSYSYDYGKDKMKKSVSQMYLDDLTRGEITLNKPPALLELLSPSSLG